MDNLTILLGSNNAGKSTLLAALDFFFNGASLTGDDRFFGSERGISVEATFDDLTPADREAFSIYARGERMVLRRSWDEGEEKITGRSRRFADFGAIRSAPGNSRRRVYREYRDENPDMGLGEATTVDKIEEELLTWEMQNGDRCDPVDADAGNLFGFRSVGQKRLADRYKFVLVPAIRDAASEAVERKGTILQRLLSAIAEQRAEADGKLADLEEEMRSRYSDLVDSSHGPTLSALGDRLTEQMRRYIPAADVQVEPHAPELSISPPNVTLRAGEAQNLTDLGRQGHGFQRTFIISALEYLAGSEQIVGGDPPTLHLAVEEPELYQHPPRARHFSSTLHALAARPAVQISYATHSPYFVGPSDLAGIRRFRQARVSNGSEEGLETKITVGDMEVVRSHMPEQKELPRFVARTLDVSLGEALFARAVLLVEGETDAAVLRQAAHLRGIDLSALGIVVAAPGKTSIPIAAAVLDSLEIKYFVLFDGDSTATDHESCETCGRGKDRRRSAVAGENVRILAVVGAPKENFPETAVHESFACFSIDLEAYLESEIAGFENSAKGIAEEMGWKMKSPEVYTELLERHGADGLPSLLAEVSDRIAELAKA
jgi:putative ATP-dependent endonuclease of the OLD family